jgi:sugar/nucleoside kinase (ribokinase family)
MLRRGLRLGTDCRRRRLVGVGGIGTGTFFALEGDHDLGRNESRPGRLLDVRDYCKLHIIAHYPAVLLGARRGGVPFHVVPVGKIGLDQAGERLLGEMNDAGMDTTHVETVDGHPTLQSVCFQYPDGSGGNVTTSDSAAALLGPEDLDAVRTLVGPDAFVLAAPEVSLTTRHSLLRLGTWEGAFRVAALTTAEVPEALRTRLLSDVDLLALNEDEAAQLVGSPLPSDDPEAFLTRCAEVLLGHQPAMRIVVTAGRRGAFAFDGAAWDRAPALPVSVASTAGAGDALLGAVIAGLAAGLPFTEAGSDRETLPARPVSSAFDLGVLVAAYKVTSQHTIPPDFSLDALVSFAAANGLALSERIRRLLPEARQERGDEW